MRKFLLDTGAMTDYLNAREPTRSRADSEIRRGNRLGICPPVIGEIHLGIELSINPTRTIQRLRAAYRNVAIWPFDKTAAIEFGRIAAHLRRAGRPMQQIDIQIAAVVLTMKSTTLVSKDSDFQAIPGLDVEDRSIAP